MSIFIPAVIYRSRYRHIFLPRDKLLSCKETLFFFFPIQIWWTGPFSCPAAPSIPTPLERLPCRSPCRCVSLSTSPTRRGNWCLAWFAGGVRAQLSATERDQGVSGLPEESLGPGSAERQDRQAEVRASVRAARGRLAHTRQPPQDRGTKSRSLGQVCYTQLLLILPLPPVESSAAGLFKIRFNLLPPPFLPASEREIQFSRWYFI